MRMTLAAFDEALDRKYTFKIGSAGCCPICHQAPPAEWTKGTVEWASRHLRHFKEPHRYPPPAWEENAEL